MMLVAIFFLVILPFWVFRFSAGKKAGQKFARGNGRKSWALHFLDNGVRSNDKAILGLAFCVVPFLFNWYLGLVTALILLVGEVAYYWGGHQWLRKNAYVQFKRSRK